MYQFFSRPDRYIARCGRLDAAVAERHIDNAPEFLHGLRALFITDPHVLDRTSQADLDRLMAAIAAIAPELLLLGGDYSDTTENTGRFFRSLGAVDVPLGKFGIVGNNDNEAWEGHIRDLKRIMRRSGCTPLINRGVSIEYNGGRIWIGGVDDHMRGAPDDSRLYPHGQHPMTYRILLSHYPVLPDHRPDLMLCGHTHGGQFNLLGITPFTVGFERLNRSEPVSVAISGLHDLGGMKLLVSKGIGASRLQLRFCVRPEMDLLIFD